MKEEHSQSPEQVELSHSEMESLIDRISKSDLVESDQTLVIRVLRFNIWLQNSLREARISIHRLKSVFFGRREKRMKKRSPKPSSGEENSEGEPKSESTFPINDTEPETSQLELLEESDSPDTTKGHGRNAHTVYTGAEEIHISHADLQSGDPCPEECGGKVYPTDPGIVIRLKGDAPVSAIRYELEVLRRDLCGERFRADLPEGESQSKKYDAASRSMVAIQKYFLGVPFHRQELFQQMIGIPLPDATQWDLCEHVADCLYPVFQNLLKIASESDCFYHDDSTNRILEMIKENKSLEKGERKGIFTTSICAESEDQKIAMFFTGRQHAGENLTDLLEKRQSLETPIKMSDALSSNQVSESEVQEAYCLVHARRNFIEIENYWPEECQEVTEALEKVYHWDELSRRMNLNQTQRLWLHQVLSAPELEEIREKMKERFEQRSVEPSSSLGKAMNYFLNHWEKLSLFLRLEGAPLDNNASERALKVPIRHRKNSLFYRTEHSAGIGDILMSVIYTCALGKVNPLDYLNQIQIHRSSVRKTPERWLPWNYQSALALAA